MMMSIHSLWFPVFLFPLFFLGCDSDTADNGTDPSGGDQPLVDPVSCDTLPYETVDERLEAGMELAMGTVQRVEPILDEFTTPHSDERATFDTCEGTIQPALRVHLQVEHASWDAKDTVVVRVEADALHQSEFQPRIGENQRIQWEKTPEFLREGASLAVGGGLVDSQQMATKLTGLYPLQDGRITEDFDAKNPCMKDDFAGRDARELIERVRSAEKREAVDMSEVLHLFSSFCLEDA